MGRGVPDEVVEHGHLLAGRRGDLPPGLRCCVNAEKIPALWVGVDTAEGEE